MPITADDLAESAQLLATSPTLRKNPLYSEISALNPIPAVIRCAEQAGALTPERATHLRNTVTEDSFAELVGPQDSLVMGPHEMRMVPPGAVIALIRVDSTNVVSSLLHRITQGKRHLIHVMISLGNGWAAGTKGANIGLPTPTQDWERINLATCLLWANFPGTYDAIAESLGRGSPRHLRIRYREIERIQSAAAPAANSSPDLVPPNVKQNYQRMEGFWYYTAVQVAADEGWKFHVSCSVANVAQILDILLPILRQAGYAHKFLMTLDEVKSQNNDSVQAGKILVVYPADILQAFTILDTIDAALAGKFNDSPPVQNEIKVGQTVVYTRYGPFIYPIMRNQGNTGYVNDTKGIPRPAWIQDPWVYYPNQRQMAASIPAWPVYPNADRRKLAAKPQDLL